MSHAAAAAVTGDRDSGVACPRTSGRAACINLGDSELPRRTRALTDSPLHIAPPRPQALGINDDSLGFVLGGVILAVGYAFAQWQSYQDDDEDDFFDTYDSRRVDRDNTNRNRV